MAGLDGQGWGLQVATGGRSSWPDLSATGVRSSWPGWACQAAGLAEQAWAGVRKLGLRASDCSRRVAAGLTQAPWGKPKPAKV